MEAAVTSVGQGWVAKTLLCDPEPLQHPQQGFKLQLTQPLGMSGR